MKLLVCKAGKKGLFGFIIDGGEFLCKRTNTTGTMEQITITPGNIQNQSVILIKVMKCALGTDQGPSDDIGFIGSVSRGRNGWSKWELNESDGVSLIKSRFDDMYPALTELNHSVIVRISIDPGGYYPGLTLSNGSFPDDLTFN